MKIITHILVLIILFTITACQAEPEVVKNRLPFEDLDKAELRPSNDDGQTIVPDAEFKRLCIDAQLMLDGAGSPPDWLQQPLPLPGEKYNEASGPDVGPVAFIVEQVRRQLDEGIEKVFDSIAEDGTFEDIAKALVTLAIIAYAAGVIVGTADGRAYPVIVAVAKISIIFALITDYDFFKDFVQDFFENSIEALIVLMSGTFTGEEVDNPIQLFNPVDANFARFFSIEFTISMLALLTTGWSGAIYAIAILLTIIVYLFAILRALYVYLLSMVVRGLLYVLAPIFIALLLFKQTSGLFRNWLIQLVSFSLQPILLFAFLGIFLGILDVFLDSLYSPSGGSKEICYMEWDIFEGTDFKRYFWQFAEDDGTIAVSGTTPEIPINIVVLLTLIILGYTMMLFSDWAVVVAGYISQGITTTSDVATSAWANVRQRVTGQAGRVAAGAGRALRGQEIFKKKESDFYGDSGKITTPRGNKALKG